jgi:hypothetical protein
MTKVIRGGKIVKAQIRADFAPDAGAIEEDKMIVRSATFFVPASFGSQNRPNTGTIP